MNKTDMHTNIIGIPSFRNGLGHSFGLTGLYFKIFVEDSREM